jgi:hypothetical protein
MFIGKNLSKNITIEDVKDRKTASVFLNEMVAQTFESLRSQMLLELKENNIPEKNHNEFLQELYKEVQLAAINRYQEILKKTEENQISQAHS